MANLFTDKAILDEFRRLNDNFERYLQHLHIPMDGDSVESSKLYVGEARSEFELAIEEHAKLTGRQVQFED
jgi:hypothetical protein